MRSREITECRLCSGRSLHEVLDLGYQLLSDFREPGYEPQSRYPLRLVVCLGCGLPQLSHNTDPALLYHNRYSFKSGISDAIGRDLAEVVAFALAGYLAMANDPPGQTPASWLDIASNDGTLLSNVPKMIYRVGVDPLRQFASEAADYAHEVIVDFFRPGLFHRLFDVITAVSMFYDLPDPQEFVRGVASILAPNGVLVIQQNYLQSMLDNRSVDNISHEHLAYYSLTHMKRLLDQAKLEINAVSFPTINGGCFRILASHRGTYRVTPEVGQTLANEKARGLTQLDTYRQFAARSRRALSELAHAVREVNATGGRVYVYGASTRGAVLWQAAGLDVKELPKVVERNPDKIGKIMTSINAPIISEQEMRADPPSYLLVGPWWLRDDFIEREREFLDAGGRMIFPLPELEVVGR